MHFARQRLYSLVFWGCNEVDFSYKRMAGKFTKIELLGSGTFGRAWLVKNISTGKKYVNKEVTVTGLGEKAKEQSLTEVAALARCKHLNIIRYRHAYVDRGMLNIVMEYADAGIWHFKVVLVITL